MKLSREEADLAVANSIEWLVDRGIIHYWDRDKEFTPKNVEDWTQYLMDMSIDT